MNNFDWALAIEKYDPTAQYRLDDSANPTKILSWNGRESKPTPEQLANIAANIKPSPNWRGFGLGLIQNSAYLRIANTLSNLNAATVMVMKIALNNVNSPENFQTVAALWNSMIADASPSEEEIAQLQAIANATFLPIVFTPDGKVNLVE